MQQPRVLITNFRRRLEKLRLDVEWSRAQKRGTIDRRIPEPAINYNISGAPTLQAYKRAFIADACLKELPSLLALANYGDDKDDFALFDYGCGLGRLAYAFTSFFGTNPKRRYVGYEVHPDAYAFLATAYSDYPNTHFFTDRIDVSESYVELHQGTTTAAHAADVNTVEFSTRIGTQVDIQFSHSVFTHMSQRPIVNALKNFVPAMRESGICVNSWLVVDRFAKAAVENGLADRTLPYEVNGFYTYSKENPLTCAAYPLATIEEMYREAGHEIVSILFGAWSGRRPDQSFTYQDIVVSRPL